MATSNNEWLQIYQNNLIGPLQQTNMQWSDDGVTHATTVTTTASSSVISNQLGRVARPNIMRRRSRASRRTPTTLLNTDTTNFRAMVQQFTGGGGGGSTTTFMAAHATTAPSRSSGSYNINSSGSNYNGMGSRISPPASGYNIEFLQPQHQQYYNMAADGDRVGGDQQHGFV